MELVADSFANVFPATPLWWEHVSPRHAIVALVGGEWPLTIGRRDVDRRLDRLRQAFPTDDEVRTTRDVYELHLGQWRPRRRGQLNTDEHPLVELLSPVSQRDQTLLQGEDLCSF